MTVYRVRVKEVTGQLQYPISNATTLQPPSLPHHDKVKLHGKAKRSDSTLPNSECQHITVLNRLVILSTQQCIKSCCDIINTERLWITSVSPRFDKQQSRTVVVNNAEDSVTIFISAVEQTAGTIAKMHLLFSSVLNLLTPLSFYFLWLTQNSKTLPPPRNSLWERQKHPFVVRADTSSSPPRLEHSGPGKRLLATGLEDTHRAPRWGRKLLTVDLSHIRVQFWSFSPLF